MKCGEKWCSALLADGICPVVLQDRRGRCPAVKTRRIARLEKLLDRVWAHDDNAWAALGAEVGRIRARRKAGR